MDFEESIRILERKAAGLEPGMNEEATKMALVAPFIRALGYDVFNPAEVVPEYTASTGNLKDARADYAIMKDGEPFAVIECKALGVPLDVKRTQLEWYFVNSPARIGILTDGNRYIFFSDLEEKNRMDAVPFMDFTLSALDDSVFPRLRLLCKDKYDEDEYLQHAERLKYSREFKRLVAEQFAAPDDEFARLFIGRVWSGKVMQSVLERFRPVLKAALDQYMNDALNARLKDAMKPSVEPEPEPSRDNSEQAEDNDGIVTYNTEEWGFFAVRALLSKYVDPVRICMKDQKTKCAVLLDGNIQKPICYFFNFRHWEEGMEDIGKNAYVLILTESNNKGEKFPVRFVDDIYPLADKMLAAVRRHDPSCGNGR